jgi:hypothetical protein
MTPFFVLVRDRLVCLQQLVAWLLDNRVPPSKIYLVDMDSTYPPLCEQLDRWEEDGFIVLRQDSNLGSWGLWKYGILANEIGHNSRFFVSDPDVVPDPACRLDLLNYLNDLLDRYPAVAKLGLGLRIDDISDEHRRKKTILHNQARFWENPLPGDELYHAAVATTFCLCRSLSVIRTPGMDKNKAGGDPIEGFICARTMPPNLGRHLSWYLDLDNLPEDEKWYYDHAPWRRVPKVPGSSWRPEHA